MARRFRLYLIGFGMGILMVYVLLLRNGDRNLTFWLPHDRVVTSVTSDSTYSRTDRFFCMLECQGIEVDSLANYLLEIDWEVARRESKMDIYEWLFTDKEGPEKRQMKFRRTKDIIDWRWTKENGKLRECDCPE